MTKTLIYVRDVRAFFAAVEGTAWAMKRAALHYHQRSDAEFGPAEFSILTDVQQELQAKGQPSQRRMALRFKPNLSFAFATFSKSVAGRRRRLALLLFAAACGGESIQRYDSAGNAIQQPSTPAPVAQLPALTGWGKAFPKDEALKDPSLLAFRDTLIAIVQRRDSAALAARLAPTVKFSFGDSKGGPAGLFAHWRQYQSMPKLWSTLSDVLSHGGVFEAGSFYAPWTFKALPDSLDAFEFLVVRDSNVVVRAKPDASDAGFGTLSYDIVRAAGPPADSLWRAIKLKDGRVGYVEMRHVRSPVDWRIGMRKSGSRWLIDFFVAGD